MACNGFQIAEADTLDQYQTACNQIYDTVKMAGALKETHTLDSRIDLIQAVLHFLVHDSLLAELQR